METTNVEIIANYREQKKKLEQLATAARKQMQARYLALLSEAGDIQTEFKVNFGTGPDLPATVKAFTIGATAKKPEQTPAESNGKKIGGLRRSLNAAIKNQDGPRIVEVNAQLAALGVTEPAATPEPALAATPATDLTFDPTPSAPAADSLEVPFEV